jgi:Glycosyl hydrolase family 65 central catalytic domain/Glycosyl hydrolase family 65, C-terminal domain
MLFYLFSADELRELFARLGYELEPDTITRNVAYYDRRSTHGSTLSRVVHAWVVARADRPRALRYFAEALQSDVSDIQQGTTAEGIHLGAMAGTVDLVQRMMTGIEVCGGVLRIDPRLPLEVRRLAMQIRYRGHTLDLQLTRDSLAIHGRERGAQPFRLAWKNEMHEFSGGATRTFQIEPSEPAKTGSWQVLSIDGTLGATEKEMRVPHIGPDQHSTLDRLPDDGGAEEAARKVRQHVEDLLDQALEESFPASDPPSIALPPEWTGQ